MIWPRRINDAAFGAEVGHGITRKLNLIRRVGNQAVHEHRRIAPQTALTVLRELFDVAIFVSYRYSSHPEVVPTQARFDPDLAKSRAPLSRTEVARPWQRSSGPGPSACPRTGR